MTMNELPCKHRQIIREHTFFVFLFLFVLTLIVELKWGICRSIAAVCFLAMQGCVPGSLGRPILTDIVEHTAQKSLVRLVDVFDGRERCLSLTLRCTLWGR